MPDITNSDQDVNFTNLDFKQAYCNDFDNSPVLDISCKYYSPDQFLDNVNETIGYSYFNLNCCGLCAHWEQFYELISNTSDNHFAFDFIGLTEVFRTNNDQRLTLPTYQKLITKSRPVSPRGGVGLFVRNGIKFTIRDDLSVFIPHVIETLFVEFKTNSKNNCVVGIIYRPNSAPLADIDRFSQELYNIIDKINSENKTSVIMGDMNLDLLKFKSHDKTNSFIENMFAAGYVPTITKPTRVTPSSATLIDHIYTNNLSNASSGIILTDIADHFGTFYYTHITNNRTCNEVTKMARNFSDRNIDNFIHKLSETDFNEVFNHNSTYQAYDIF